MSRSRHVRGKGKYREKRWLKYVGLGTESNRWSKRYAARKARREGKADE